MQVIGDIFNLFFYGPILNVLVGIYHALNFVHLPGALGFAIILMTVLIRLAVWPLMASQMKSVKKMAELKPHIDALKEKHKGDKQAFASAQMALYKEHGVNPAGGCLPSLLQFPIIIALYQTIFAFFSDGSGLEKINQALYLPAWHLPSAPDLTFFGLNLATKPSDFLVSAFILVPLVTAGLQFAQSKMMAQKPVAVYKTDKPKEIKEKGKSEDAMAAMQGQMMYMMPLMVGWFAFQFPIGIALYWNTFTILGIVQQHKMSGWGGLEGWIKKVQSLTPRLRSGQE